MADTNFIDDLVRKYRSTCTVPKHPKFCPECGSKVGVYHLNYTEAVFLCSNKECIWPLVTHQPQDILGHSDVKALVKVSHEKRKLSHDASLDTSLYSEEDCSSPRKTEEASDSGDLKNSASKDDFHIPQVLSPMAPSPASVNAAKTPVRDALAEDFPTPQLLSPIPPSPLPHSVPNTPIRDDADEFIKPSSTAGTSRKLSTPMHFPNMFVPPMLSPLPGTPYRSRDSERSVNIEYDLNLTDSEMSDIESTPRRPSHTPGPDMPSLGSPFPRPSKHAYSKDLSQIGLESPCGNDLPPSPSTTPPSSMKIMLKRNSGNNWNVENTDQDAVLPDRPALSGKQPMKLDKVVLNLKKSVVGNTWNIAEKTTMAEPNSGCSTSTAEQSLPPKEERRGRKSKLAPMKIQKGDKAPAVQALSVPTTSAPSVPTLTSVSSVPVTTTPEAVTSASVLTASKPLPPALPTSLLKLPPPSVLTDIGNAKGPVRITPPVVKRTTNVSLPTESSQLKGKITKTFSRKDKPTRVKLDSINMVPMAEQVSTTLAKKPTSFENNWKEVAELASKAASAFNPDDGFSELSNLMKAATGSKDIDLNFVKQVQSRLNINSLSRSGLVTFFVNRSKTSIDLPTEDTTMSVSELGAAVQVRLSSHSDGIIGDILKNKDPIPHISVESRKKGRPKGKNPPAPSHSPPPTMVPQPIPRHLNSSLDMPLPLPSHLQPPNAGADDVLTNPAVVASFKHHLNVLMQNYELPPEWAHYNIDPFVAMMVTRSQDVAYSNINFEAMLNLYARIVNHEMAMQQTGYVPPPPPENSAQGNAAPSSRTYAELQTVRGGSQVTNATQVLRQHHQKDKAPDVMVPNDRGDPQQEEEQTPAPATDQPNRLTLKQEAMTPAVDTDPSSVNVMSVRPAPPSVSMVSGHMASQMQDRHGKIGQGDLVVSFNYRSGHFGPIYARSEDEVRAIVALTESKVEEREYRDQHGGRRSSGVYASAAATRARSVLPPDVVSYLDRAFTKRGMKENIVGRKRRNYPQRSRIIRKDPITGQFMYPNGEVVLSHINVKAEIIDAPTVSSSSDSALQVVTEPETLESVAMQLDAEEIIGNTVSSTSNIGDLDEEDTYRPSSKVAKISTSLFGGKRRKQLAALDEKQEQSRSSLRKSAPKSAQVFSTPKISKQYGRARKPSEDEQLANQIIDSILSQSSKKKEATSSSQQPSQSNHSINTRRKSSTLGENRAAKSLTPSTYFNPESLFQLPNASQEVYVRPDKSGKREEQIRKFLEKKRKKEEKQRKRQLKKKMISSGSQYRGMGQDSDAPNKSSVSKRFTKAQPIDGRKMILKESGQVVDVAPTLPPPLPPPSSLPVPSSSKQSSQLTQGERELMEQLVSLGDLFDTEPSQPPPAQQFVPPPAPTFMQNDLDLDGFNSYSANDETTLQPDFSALDDMF